LDIGITEEEADKKYRTWCYKKMQRKKILAKVEDFKVHHRRYSAG